MRTRAAGDASPSPPRCASASPCVTASKARKQAAANAACAGFLDVASRAAEASTVGPRRARPSAALPGGPPAGPSAAMTRAAHSASAMGLLDGPVNVPLRVTAVPCRADGAAPSALSPAAAEIAPSSLFTTDGSPLSRFVAASLAAADVAAASRAAISREGRPSAVGTLAPLSPVDPPLPDAPSRWRPATEASVM